jgi:proteasome lid subunit RPN8/RPN11
VEALLLEQVIEHTRMCLPEEGCGFLIGHRNHATRFLPVPNALGSAQEYQIEPQVLFNLFRDLRSSGEDLVGICHSHPVGPAWPSERDVAEAHYPSSFHVIVSFGGSEPETRAFRIEAGQVLEAEIHASC